MAKAKPKTIVETTTDRQDEYLKFIREFHVANDYPPTLDEIADKMKVKVGSVQSVLASLQTKGFVTWKKGQYRTLTILKGR
jgi:Mn-dependent DtxR family transcriptional regulator